MTYLPIIVGGVLFVVCFPSLFVLGLLIVHLCKHGVLWFFATMPAEIDREQVKAHLDRLRREAEMPEDVYLVEDDMEEKRKQYRKVVKTEPPGLIRIKELGWRNQVCGHAVYEWSDLHQQCLQCVAEGRQAARYGGRQ